MVVYWAGNCRLSRFGSGCFVPVDNNFIFDHFRRLFVWFVTWPPFEWLIIITIMSNCVVMSMDSRIANNDKTILSLQLEELEPVFMVEPDISHGALQFCSQGIFTVEMCTKIVAMGFILHENSYLRNMWNIMDFVVVVSGYVLQTINNSKSNQINKISTKFL